MRVIIIGAGLGGLCLAQGLRRAGVDVGVYERDTGVEARFQGYRIGLGGPGWDALLACLPPRLHELLHATSGELAGPGRLVDEQLTELGLDEDEPLAQSMEANVVDRHVLRHLLLAGLGDTVTFGAALQTFAELPDGTVRATFADGSSVTGDVLVGADGVGSAVRTQLAGPVERIGTGVRGVIGRTPLTARFAGLVPGRGTMVTGPGLDLFLGKMPFRRPPREAAAELAPDVHLPSTTSYLRWVMLLPPENTTVVDEQNGEGALELVGELIRDWHPDLRELIRQADASNSSLGEMRYVPPIEPWPSGRVTLLGDAAHTMLPSGGMGANTAFHDAALLVERLVAGDVARDVAGDVVAAIAAYEREMLAYSRPLVEAGRQALDRFQGLREVAGAATGQN